MGKIRFYTDATRVGMPFVNINKGCSDKVIMLIDTGSTDNSLFAYAYKQAKEKYKEVEGGDHSLYGIEGKEAKAKCVVGTINFLGKDREMYFLVREDDEADAGLLLSEQMGFPVVGIIGTSFMVEHNWKIDFANQEIIIPEFDIWPEDFKKVLASKKSSKT